ncbi:CaiB/BaiF CoA transferase family protein [Bordetella petrii]|uniref:CaiB/BaiF CoA transferase family protein n=1 Tax=Bordetella petrii TaxID=94624 RepID=UPI001E5EFF7A|nr:CoA transferase [Bordetella petrii]MCD0504578.1 CoA transferase [Bordetella petrii]
MNPAQNGPLAGVRILDVSTVVAGPWAATLLADLGAEVLKVEMPGRGDPLRDLAPHKEGVPLWWKVANRNKKGISLDLRTEDARDILARLLPDFDVLVENFRPGTLDRWGITRGWLHQHNPRLTILRLTGFGQTGPYRSKPGFARVFEAMSGLTHICGEPDGRPLHMGFPIADAVAGLFGALGIVSALYRDKVVPGAQGQEIDCSLMESMFRVMDFLPIEYDQLGIVRGRQGNRSQYAAPGNVYLTRDGHWASIAASTQRIFERLCQALGLDHVLQDGRFATNPGRVQHREALDAILAEAIGGYTLSELGELLEANAVGFSPIYDIADIFADPHFAARQAIVSVPDGELGTVRMQAVVPRFSHTPGGVRHAGPALGQHNDEVLAAIGISESQRERLRHSGVI